MRSLPEARDRERRSSSSKPHDPAITPTQPIGADAVGRYRDRIFDDPRHDPYQSTHKYADSTRCPDCGAWCLAGRWQNGPSDRTGPSARCPACRRIADGMPAGTLELDNPVSPHSGATLTIESASSPMPQIISGGDTTFHHQLRHVIQVIEGRVQPLTGGDDAIGNMRAIDAIYRAAGLKPRGLSS